jgi:lysophospholipase L1-like esterase
MAMKAPIKTGLAVVTCVAALAAYRRWVDQGKGISPGIFADAVRVKLLRHAPGSEAQEVAKEKPRPRVVEPGAREPISEFLIDDAGSLDGFYAQLRGLEKRASAATPVGDGLEPGKAKVVTVLHYGDSPTTADLITGDVRAMLQQRFGDGGRGFLLAGRPWAWYSHRGVDLDDKGWTISTAVGKGREEVYGIGGASFEGGEGASTRIKLQHGEEDDKGSVEISYLARPQAGALSVAVNGVLQETFPTDAATAEPRWRTVPLAGAKTIEMKPVGAPVRLFGETFLTGRPGVVYDSLGLNGASTSVLSYGFNARTWTAELQHERPALVVINYGTNESQDAAYVNKQYEASLRKAIDRIRAALPGEPILVMSPMDRGRRTGVDQIETYETIPKIVDIQRKVAAEQGCAFFDTFEAMGGDGTMARWYNGHPRLVAGDLIHPTPQGAGMVAQLLVKDLMTGYDLYVKRQSKVEAATDAAAKVR